MPILRVGFGPLAFVASILLVTVLGCGGGQADSEAAPPGLSGKLLYVDEVGGKDRLYLDPIDSSGRNAREISIESVTVLAAHDADVVNLTPDQIVTIGPPVWNPDATKIAIVVARAANQSQMLTLDPETGAATTASSQVNEVDDPDWSPDGRFVAYILGDPDFSNPRLAVTDVESGETHEIEVTRQFQILAHRWDQDSSGLYIARIDLQAENPSAIVHIAIDTGLETLVRDTPTPLTQDLTREGGRLWSINDPEYVALVWIPPGAITGDAVKLSSGFGELPFYGWFLSGSGLIAVEQLAGGVRKPPLIAKPVATGSQTTGFEFFSVQAPVPFKWDLFTLPM